MASLLIVVGIMCYIAAALNVLYAVFAAEGRPTPEPALEAARLCIVGLACHAVSVALDALRDIARNSWK